MEHADDLLDRSPDVAHSAGDDQGTRETVEKSDFDRRYLGSDVRCDNRGFARSDGQDAYGVRVFVVEPELDVNILLRTGDDMGEGDRLPGTYSCMDLGLFLLSFLTCRTAQTRFPEVPAVVLFNCIIARGSGSKWAAPEFTWSPQKESDAAPIDF